MTDDTQLPKTLPTEASPETHSEQTSEASRDLTSLFPLAGFPPLETTKETAHETPLEMPSESPEVPTSGVSVLNQLQKFSEQVISNTEISVPAEFPFSLKITGALLSAEKERLIEILAREKIGVRELDLEPQFESGRILIPRISEFAGILLIQALRATSAKMELYPSDLLGGEENEYAESAHLNGQVQMGADLAVLGLSAAEQIPITTEASLFQFPGAIVLDTVTATASIQAQSVELEKSTEYQTLLDSLQKELKFKAFRKGAEGIINFQIQLIPLQFPTRYRLLLTGQAVSRC